MKVVSYNHLGLSWTFEDNDIQFVWNQVVLAEISFSRGNPIHKCVASDFRTSGKKEGITCLCWNPSWDGEKLVEISKLNHFKVLSLVW